MRPRFMLPLIGLLGLMTATTACRADINRDILDCQAQSPESYGIGQSSRLSATFHEAQAQWGVQRNNYQSCLGNGGGSTCRNPGPPPAIR